MCSKSDENKNCCIYSSWDRTTSFVTLVSATTLSAMKATMVVSLREKMAKEKKVRDVEKERKREQREEERYKQFTALEQ